MRALLVSLSALILFQVSASGAQPGLFAAGLHEGRGRAVPAASADDIVVFNTKSLKYHDPSCIWAKRCTVHCIKVKRSQARERGGVPCKVCGGGE